jgi:hypothetical protein
MSKKYTTRNLVLLIILVLLLSVIALKPSWQIGGDGFGYYTYARSLFFDGDFDLNNEFALYDQLYGHHTVEGWQTASNNVGNPFAVGSAILWSPFIILAQLVDSLFTFADSFDLTGYNLPYQIAIAAGTWFYFTLGAVFIFKALARLVDKQYAWWGTVVAVALSPAPFYLIYEPSMAHGLTVFSSALVFYFSIKIYQARQWHWQSFVCLGIVTGLLFLLRWQDILLVVIPVGIVLSRLFDKFRQSIKKVLLAVLSFIIIILPQLFMWRYIFGSWITVPQGETFFKLSDPNVWQFLFSSYHGMLVVHPLFILSLLGLWGAFKKYKLLTSLMLLALLLQVYMNSALYDWYGGGSFGARRMVSSLFIFAWGWTYLFSKISIKKTWKKLVITLIFTGILFNGLLMMSYAKQIIPLNKFTTYQELYMAPLKVISNL